MGYSPEIRALALKMAQKVSPREAAKGAGVPLMTLKGWLREEQKDHISGVIKDNLESAILDTTATVVRREVEQEIEKNREQIQGQVERELKHTIGTITDGLLTLCGDSIDEISALIAEGKGQKDLPSSWVKALTLALDKAMSLYRLLLNEPSQITKVSGKIEHEHAIHDPKRVLSERLTAQGVIQQAEEIASRADG